MLRKKKNKHRLPQVEVNIISLMDILTTLLFFILMVMSFTKLSVLEGSSLKAGTSSDDKKNVFSLKVAIISKGKARVYLGPLTDLKMVAESDFKRFLRRRFRGNTKSGYNKIIYGKNIKHLLGRIQKSLIGIKKAFPHENKLVLAFSDKVEYQEMIDAMAGMKQLPNDSEGYVLTNLIGQQEKTKLLFPEVIIAEM